MGTRRGGGGGGDGWRSVRRSSKTLVFELELGEAVEAEEGRVYIGGCILIGFFFLVLGFGSFGWTQECWPSDPRSAAADRIAASFRPTRGLRPSDPDGAVGCGHLGCLLCSLVRVACVMGRAGFSAHLLVFWALLI
jgi:hypothetical protein